MRDDKPVGDAIDKRKLANELNVQIASTVSPRLVFGGLGVICHSASILVEKGLTNLKVSHRRVSLLRGASRDFTATLSH